MGTCQRAQGGTKLKTDEQNCNLQREKIFHQSCQAHTLQYDIGNTESLLHQAHLIFCLKSSINHITFL